MHMHQPKTNEEHIVIDDFNLTLLSLRTTRWILRSNLRAPEILDEMSFVNRMNGNNPFTSQEEKAHRLWESCELVGGKLKIFMRK